MGLFDNVDLPAFVDNINLAGVGQGFLIFALMLLVAVIIGAGIFFYYSKKFKKQQFKHKIPIFMEINGKRRRVEMDTARELFVPDSNISLYFLKIKKIFLPRPTRAMGKDEYWYSISQNGEWVNFDLSSDSEQNTLAQANYDHRDTRYAYVNLKDIIKKNYKDKAVQWWKEYSHVISFVIIAAVMIAGCWLLIAKLGKTIDFVSVLVERAADIQCPKCDSGIIPG